MLTISRFPDSSRLAPIWVLAALLVGILVSETSFASKAARDPDRATLLALGDWDSNAGYRISRHGNAALLLNSKGELIRQIARATVKKGYGGCRGVSASRDGRFFVVCDSLGEGMSMYRTANGVKLWSLSGLFGSAVFADGLIYALATESVYAIDQEGTIVKHSRIGGGGIDVAFDPSGKCLWIVGMDVKKCSLDLKLQFKVKLPFGVLHGAAFSVDVNPDGSVWVAARNVCEREGDANQLAKISPEGRLLNVIPLDFCPLRVRVEGLCMK